MEPTEKVKEEPEWDMGCNQALLHPADDVLEASIPFDSSMFSAPRGVTNCNEATKVAEMLKWDERYGQEKREDDLNVCKFVTHD